MIEQIDGDPAEEGIVGANGSLVVQAIVVGVLEARDRELHEVGEVVAGLRIAAGRRHRVAGCAVGLRSEERRVGQEGRSRWPPYHYQDSERIAAVGGGRDLGCDQGIGEGTAYEMNW